MLNKIKLFGKMKIFEKIENKTSISFRKSGLTERENMVTLNHRFPTFFSLPPTFLS